MTALLGLIFSILISLYVWGIIRTAIWILPTLLFGTLSPVFSLSMLSFFFVTALVTPYQQGAFEIRKLTKDRWVMIFFFTGVLTGAFFYPTTDVLIFAIGAGFPLLVVNLLRLLRQPPSQVLFLKKKFRTFPIALFGLTAVSAIAEYFEVAENFFG